MTALITQFRISKTCVRESIDIFCLRSVSPVKSKYGAQAHVSLKYFMGKVHKLETRDVPCGCNLIRCILNFMTLIWWIWFINRREVICLAVAGISLCFPHLFLFITKSRTRDVFTRLIILSHSKRQARDYTDSNPTSWHGNRNGGWHRLLALPQFFKWRIDDIGSSTCVFIEGIKITG